MAITLKIPTCRLFLESFAPWRLGLMLACLLVSACAARPPVSPPPTVSTVPDVVLPEQIRSHLAGGTDTDIEQPVLVQGLSLDQGLAEFYRLRDYRPAWNDPALLDQLLAVLEDLRFDGLDPIEYSLPALLGKRPQSEDMTSVTERVERELLATRACLLALVHLHQGRVDPNQLESQWNFSTHALDPGAGLQALNAAVEQADIASVFDQARPQQPVYLRLREGLRRLYAIEAVGGWPVLPDGPSLKPGMLDPRVPLLRQRMVAAGLLPQDWATGTLYDEMLADSVKQFQREQYLEADGAVGKATRAVLNVPVQARIAQVRANLERARWLLHEIQGDFVLVDVAGFKVYFYRDGEPVWSSRVQVGKPYRSTPIFKSRVTYVTFNPTWTIPPTILKEDVLPKIRQDLAYLEQHQLQVLDSRGTPLDPAQVDWHQPGNILLRQRAGDMNPLGKAVIRFPNPHAIYLHDTPSQRMFDNGQRAFSSGCIRVERPLELVELLFSDQRKWNRAGIDAAIASGETRDVGFMQPVPILLTYSTVEVVGDGRLVFKPDIYQRDPALIAALDRPVE